MRELQGMAAIVTGGARNIGRAIALSLAEGGADVALVGRADMEGLEETAILVAKAGSKATVIQADITKPDDVKGMAGGHVAGARKGLFSAHFDCDQG